MGPAHLEPPVREEAALAHKVLLAGGFCGGSSEDRAEQGMEPGQREVGVGVGNRVHFL